LFTYSLTIGYCDVAYHATVLRVFDNRYREAWSAAAGVGLLYWLPDVVGVQLINKLRNSKLKIIYWYRESTISMHCCKFCCFFNFCLYLYCPVTANYLVHAKLYHIVLSRVESYRIVLFPVTAHCIRIDS